MKVKIYFSDELSLSRTHKRLLSMVKNAVCAALTHENFPYNAEVSVTFTDNAGIRALNKEYRGVDSPTDVLSFPLYDYLAGEKPDDQGLAQLGDIVISLERAREQAEEYGHSFRREIAFLTVHSVLHLLGYDHENSEAEECDMFMRQDAIMEELGIGRD